MPQAPPLIRIPLRGDIYRIHRLPGSNLIALNDDYQGVQILDPWSGKAISTASFDPSFAHGGGVVDLWCFKHDGSQIVAFHLEKNRASLISLDTQSTPIPLELPQDGGPPWSERCTDMRYVWDHKGLLLTDSRGLAFFRLHHEEKSARLEKAKSLQVRKLQPAWRRALTSTLSGHTRIPRVYSDASAMIALDVRDKEHFANLLRWVPEDLAATEARNSIDDAAALPQCLVTLEKEGVFAHAAGKIRKLLDPPPGFSFRGLELLPATPTHPAALILLARSETDLLAQHLLLYPLSQDGRLLASFQNDLDRFLHVDLDAVNQRATVHCKPRGRARLALFRALRDGARRLQEWKPEKPGPWTRVLEFSIATETSPLYRAGRDEVLDILRTIHRGPEGEENTLRAVDEIHLSNAHGTLYFVGSELVHP